MMGEYANGFAANAGSGGLSRIWKRQSDVQENEMAQGNALFRILPEQHRVPVRAPATGEQTDAESEGPVLHAITIAPRETSRPAGHARHEVSDPHDEIIERLPDDFVRRMRNWARSLDGSSVGTSSALWGMVGGGSYEARIPVMMGEADDTDKAVRKLAMIYRQALEVFWLYHARPLSWMARATPMLREQRLGPYSFRQMLETAHLALLMELRK